MKKNGVTLMELMVVLVIMSIVMFVIFTLFRQSGGLLKRHQDRAQLLLESRSASETLVRLLQRARAGHWQISSLDGRHPYSRIDIEEADTGQKIGLFARDGALWTERDSGAPVKLADHIAYLTFTADGTDLSVVRFTLRLQWPVAGTELSSLFIANQEVHLVQ